MSTTRFTLPAETTLDSVRQFLLQPTDRLPGDDKTRRGNQTPSGQNKLGPSPDRWKERSRTFPGIAKAMAEQWGG